MAHQMMRQQQLASTSRSTCSKSIVQQPLMSVRRVGRQTQRLQQQQLVCMSSKLEDVPLFADASSVGSKTSGAAASSSNGKAGATKLEDIPLNSEVNQGSCGCRGCTWLVPGGLAIAKQCGLLDSPRTQCSCCHELADKSLLAVGTLELQDFTEMMPDTQCTHNQP